MVLLKVFLLLLTGCTRMIQETPRCQYFILLSLYGIRMGYSQFIFLSWGSNSIDCVILDIILIVANLIKIYCILFIIILVPKRYCFSNPSAFRDAEYCWVDLWCLMPLSTIFQLYRHMGVSFIGGGNQFTWRKPLPCHKALTNMT